MTQAVAEEKRIEEVMVKVAEKKALMKAEEEAAKLAVEAKEAGGATWGMSDDADVGNADDDDDGDDNDGEGGGKGAGIDEESDAAMIASIRMGMGAFSMRVHAVSRFRSITRADRCCGAKLLRVVNVHFRSYTNVIPS